MTWSSNASDTSNRSASSKRIKPHTPPFSEDDDHVNGDDLSVSPILLDGDTVRDDNFTPRQSPHDSPSESQPDDQDDVPTEDSPHVQMIRERHGIRALCTSGDLLPISSDDHEFGDTEKEEISAAVYFPHEGIDPESPEISADPRISPAPKPKGDSVAGGSDEDEPPRKPEYLHLPPSELSLVSHAEPSPTAVTAPPELSTPPRRPSFQNQVIPFPSSSGSLSGSESIRSFSSISSESEILSESEHTPINTPRASHLYSDQPHGSTRSKPSIATLPVVELKPYRHQVGGHSQVFRFSKKAVCKPLTNRENYFYEILERNHPDMLRYLPR